MNFNILFLLVSAGICFSTGLSHLAIGLFTKPRKPIHLNFSFACFTIFLYNFFVISDIIAIEKSNLAQLINSDDWLLFFGYLGIASTFLFTNQFSGILKKQVTYPIVAFYVTIALINFILPYNWVYHGIEETVEGNFIFKVSPLYTIEGVLTISIFCITGFMGTKNLLKTNKKSMAYTFSIAITSIIITFLWDYFFANSNIVPFILLAQYGFLTFILIMSVYQFTYITVPADVNHKYQATMRTLLNSPTDYCIILSQNGMLQNVNEKALSLIDKSYDDVIGTSFWNLFEPQIVEQHKNRLHALIESKQQVHFEEMFNNSFLDVRLLPVLDEFNEILAVAVIARDISEQKEAQNELENRDKMLHKAQLIAKFAAWEYDFITKKTFFSKEACEMYGYDGPPESITLEYVKSLFTNEEITESDEEFRSAIMQQKPFEKTLPLTLPDGYVKWIYTKVEFDYHQNGYPIKATGIVRDITSQKDAENKLIEAQKNHKEFLETTSERISYWYFPEKVSIDLPIEEQVQLLFKAKCIYSNPAENKALGSGPDHSIVGWDILSILEKDYYIPIFTEFIQNGYKLTNKEISFKLKNGKVLYGIEYWYGKVKDGYLTNIYSISKDVTETIVNETYYQTLFNKGIDAIMLVGLNGITDCNTQALELFGCERDEIIGKTPGALSPELQLNGKNSKSYANERIQEALQSGESQLFEWKHQRFDGSFFDAEIHLAPIVLKESTACFVVIRDITERKEALKREELHREQLLQADKLTSLGVLVSGVAHEINNPNNFIMLNTPLLKDAWNDSLPILEQYFSEQGNFSLGGIPFNEMRDTIPKLFMGLENGARRIQNTVEELKNYARKDSNHKKTKINVNDLVTEAIKLLNSLITKSTNFFNVHLTTEPVYILGNKQKIEQVIVNLIQNSCEALENKDNAINLTVSTNDNNVILVVEDEGCGITPHNLKQIKDPFFTTRRGKGGTGLGLSVSNDIVLDHKGTLEYSSEKGKGTVAKVKIPQKI